MLYQILRTIIDTSLNQYICQNCGSKVDESSVAITTITENSVDLRIICQNCQGEAQMHAEIGGAVQNGFIHGQEKPLAQKMMKKNEHALKESDIATIEKNLTETSSIEDLLK